MDLKSDSEKCAREGERVAGVRCEGCKLQVDRIGMRVCHDWILSLYIDIRLRMRDPHQCRQASSEETRTFVSLVSFRKTPHRLADTRKQTTLTMYSHFTVKCIQSESFIELYCVFGDSTT